MKPFLILQLRPEDEASDGEFDAFLKISQLDKEQLHRVRMEKTGLPPIKLKDYSGVIVGGGPTNVSDQDKTEAEKKFEKQLHTLLDEIIEKDFPYLGACYGLSILAVHLGGEVAKGKYAESVGAVTINLADEAKDDPILNDLPGSFRAFGGHKESCQSLPEGMVCLAGSKKCPVHIVRYKKNIYATQFHPELDSHGTALRIRVYKHAGYFPPSEADKLIADAMQETVAIPEKILQRFVQRYQTIS
jgi:GMP synthase (glutamine-hydrolysing)